MLLVVAGSAAWAVQAGSAQIQPGERAALISTSGCGDAGTDTGSGVAVGGDVVLTAAHVVAQADAITVTIDDRRLPALVVAWDGQRDVAVLRADGLDLPDVAYGEASAGDPATLVGGRASGTQDGSVVQRATVTIEEVLGTERYARLGYQLEITAADGDSGAGVYDQDGRLTGMLFAVERESQLAWATAAEELRRVLTAPETTHRCVEERSRLLPSAGGDALHGLLAALGDGVPARSDLPIGRQDGAAGR